MVLSCRTFPRRLVQAARSTVRPDFALAATDPARVSHLPVHGCGDQSPLESGLIARHRALGQAGPREPALLKEPGRGRVEVLSAQHPESIFVTDSGCRPNGSIT